MPEPERSFPCWPGWTTKRLLGWGSFGAVYEIERQVGKRTEKSALKVISIPKDSGETSALSQRGYDSESIAAYYQKLKESIEDEYSMMAALKGCANVVYCDDIRTLAREDGIGWEIQIRMELLRPLTELPPEAMDEKQVVRLGKDMCSALVMCQEQNIIHRDIKPQNIFVARDGTFKLGDFGIAKAIEHTASGTMTGTFHYMAPEVETHRPYNRTVDIYSLGLVLYRYLNRGRLPFMPLPPEKITADDETRAGELRLRGVPFPNPADGSDALKKIVLKACAFDPKERYQSASEMLEELEALDRTGAAAPADPIEKKPESLSDEEKTVDGSERTGSLPEAVLIADRPEETAAPAQADETADLPPKVETERISGPDAVARPGKRFPWRLAAGILALVIALVVFLPGRLSRSPQAPAATAVPSTLPRSGTADVSSPAAERDGETALEETAQALIAPAVMTYAEFCAAGIDSAVTVETYAQAKQNWRDNRATFYTQAEDGAYFLYDMVCSEEEFEQLVPGTRIRVSGYKSEWAGEIEITDASFEILEAEPFIAAAADVTALLGTDKLIGMQNMFVSFKGMTVEPYDEGGAAFAYKNPEDRTDDLYFRASRDGQICEFCVEFSLCGQDTEVYRAVEALEVGDVIDLEGFLYWYEGPNPHVTSLTRRAWSEWSTEEPEASDESAVQTATEYRSRTRVLLSTQDPEAVVGEIDHVELGSVTPGRWRPWRPETVEEAEDRQIEETTQYRFRAREFTSSSEPELEGWTLDDTHESSYWSGWTDWSANPVAASDTREVDTQTLYRYRDMIEQMDSFETYIPGWERVAKNKIVTVGSGAGWTEEPATPTGTPPSESAAPPGIWDWTTVETKTETYPDGSVHTLYLVNHYHMELTFVFMRYGDWSEWSTDEAHSATSGRRQAESQTLYRYRDRYDSTTYDYWRWGVWSPWSMTEPEPSEDAEIAVRTVYRYRDATAAKTYYYYDWSDWSDWTRMKVEESETRQVETRTVYRRAVE